MIHTKERARQLIMDMETRASVLRAEGFVPTSLDVQPLASVLAEAASYLRLAVRDVSPAEPAEPSDFTDAGRMSA